MFYVKLNTTYRALWESWRENRSDGERTRERDALSYEFTVMNPAERDVMMTPHPSAVLTPSPQGEGLRTRQKGGKTMSREKPYFREVVADIIERTGKTILGVNDLKKFLGVGHNKAVGYLEKGEKTITAYQLAQKLI